jgi:hypothetical protein
VSQEAGSFDSEMRNLYKPANVYRFAYKAAPFMKLTNKAGGYQFETIEMEVNSKIWIHSGELTWRLWDL